jgi:hypothetical protein
MKLAFPLNQFLKRAADDHRLFTTHMSLFMAIFYYSSPLSPFEEFRICRRQLMRFSRIKSKATYHKCLSELVLFGYIKYQPSYDPFKASTISIIQNGDAA